MHSQGGATESRKRRDEEAPGRLVGIKGHRRPPPPPLRASGWQSRSFPTSLQQSGENKPASTTQDLSWLCRPSWPKPAARSSHVVTDGTGAAPAG